MGSGEEGPDDSGRGGRGHVLDGDRGHLVHSQNATPEEEEQDGTPQQVRDSCRGHHNYDASTELQTRGKFCRLHKWKPPH